MSLFSFFAKITCSFMDKLNLKGDFYYEKDRKMVEQSHHLEGIC